MVERIVVNTLWSYPSPFVSDDVTPQVFVYASRVVIFRPFSCVFFFLKSSSLRNTLNAGLIAACYSFQVKLSCTCLFLLRQFTELTGACDHSQVVCPWMGVNRERPKEESVSDFLQAQLLNRFLFVPAELWVFQAQPDFIIGKGPCE